MLLRFVIAFVLSIVYLTSSACADFKPAVDTSENNRAEYEATAKELRKLAEEGNVTAQNGLGLLYKVGAGVPQNYGQAKKWFEEAAKQGHAEAQVNLGTLYLDGDGPPQSAQMALFWFSRAAEQGDVPAFAKLGLMYAQAQGVPQDFIQAHMWFLLAAANGDENSAESRDISRHEDDPCPNHRGARAGAGVEANEQISRLETPHPLRYSPRDETMD